MHTYSINRKEKITVLGMIGILSMLIIWAIYEYLPSGVPVPSVLAVFSAIFFVFDKWAWRWAIFSKTCIDTPNLNGKWKMLSKSSITGFNKEYVATLTIKQTWTHIFLFMDGEKATSESLMAGIEVMTDDLFHLKWEYRAQYKPAFAAGSKTHHGMTKLTMRPLSNPDELDGNYYTDEGRDSQGPITLYKMKKA